MLRLSLPEYRQTRQVLVASLCITAAIFLWLARLRTGAAPPSPDVFRFLVREQDFVATLPFVVVLLLALMPGTQAAGRALVAFAGRNGAIVAAGTTAVLAVGANVVYHAHPLAMDEYAPFFQSAAFAAGELAGRYPPELIDWLIPKSFQGHFFKLARDTGSVASTYWPGHALLLTPFTAIGMPWLLNPVIGGATVLVMHRLALDIFGDQESAGFTVLFTVASTAVSINALSFYSMPAHLLASALFVLLLLRRSAWSAFAAGAVGSFALVLHNPVPHLLFALPWIIWVAMRSDRLRLLAALGAGYVPLSLAIGWGWAIFLQDLGRAPLGGQLAAGVAHGTILGLDNLLRLPSGWIVEARVIGLAKVWLWAVPAMVAVATMGAWRSRNDTGFWLVLVASALLTFSGYLLIPLDQGHGWGFRYFHSAWLALPLFAVHFLKDEGTAAEEKDLLRGYMAGCALLGLVVMTAFQGVQVERFISRHLAQLPAPKSDEQRIMFVEPAAGYYSKDLVQNDPFLRKPAIVFVSRGRDRDQAMMRERFPQFRLSSSDERGSVWAPASERPQAR